MTRSLSVSPVIICFLISIQCQGWLSGRSGSEALGSEALIRSQSTGIGRIEGDCGLRCAELKGDGIEVLGLLGSDALGSEVLAGKQGTGQETAG